MGNNNSWKLYRDRHKKWWIYCSDTRLKLNMTFGGEKFATAYIKYIVEYYDFHRDHRMFVPIELKEMISIIRSNHCRT
jgi:hypothetical protein